MIPFLSNVILISVLQHSSESCSNEFNYCSYRVLEGQKETRVTKELLVKGYVIALFHSAMAQMN